MDTVGSSGVVVCHDKERGRKYMVCFFFSCLFEVDLSCIFLSVWVTYRSIYWCVFMTQSAAMILWVVQSLTVLISFPAFSSSSSLFFSSSSSPLLLLVSQQSSLRVIRLLRFLHMWLFSYYKDFWHNLLCIAAVCGMRCVQFMVQSQMSRLRLTKIITVLPFFLVINQSNRKLRYMEENPNADLWLDITKGDVSHTFEFLCSSSLMDRVPWKKFQAFAVNCLVLYALTIFFNRDSGQVGFVKKMSRKSWKLSSVFMSHML